MTDISEVSKESINLYNKKLKNIHDTIMRYYTNHEKYPNIPYISYIASISCHQDITNIVFNTKDSNTIILESLNIDEDISKYKFSSCIRSIIYFDNINFYCKISQIFNEEKISHNYYTEILNNLNV